MENNREFRDKYAKLSTEEFRNLPEEELIQISKVKYKTGIHAGSFHYLALRAQHILHDRRFNEQRKPGEIKIIKPAEEKQSNITLHIKASREEMIKNIKKKYTDPYLSRILNHQDEAPQKTDYNRIISYLRRLFTSMYDFRQAKQMLNIDNLNRLEACYVANVLSNMYENKRLENKEKWKQSILNKYGSWQNYFKACGWIEHKGSYYKPDLIKKTSDPDVLKPFHVVTYHLEKRKGYRGKKSEIKKKTILESRSC